MPLLPPLWFLHFPQDTRPGSLDANYGSRKSGRAGAILKLEADQSLTGLTFKSTLGGAISGAIRDGYGEPIQDTEP